MDADAAPGRLHTLARAIDVRGEVGDGLGVAERGRQMFLVEEKCADVGRGQKERDEGGEEHGECGCSDG